MYDANPRRISSAVAPARNDRPVHSRAGRNRGGLWLVAERERRAAGSGRARVVRRIQRQEAVTAARERGIRKTARTRTRWHAMTPGRMHAMRRPMPREPSDVEALLT